VENYYRIGITSEGNLLLNNPDTYHGVVIGGNFAALYKDWLATFLQKLKKPFFVDPRSEVFGQDLNFIKKDGDFRSSFKKMIEQFDSTAKSKHFSNLLKRGKLIPDDFIISKSPRKWNVKLINILVNGTTSIQKDVLNLDTSSNKKSIKKYLKILEELGEQDDVPDGPEFYVAPYFYFPNTSSPWFEINLKLLDAMKRNNPTKPVYAVLCFDKDMMESADDITKIISNYKNADGLLLWIGGFPENKMETTFLKNYSNLIQRLVEIRKPIINLYGSYFTTALSKYRRISGYCRGIGIGDSKEVEASATGGGIPNRYYLPLTHDFVVEEVAITTLARHPDLRCKCDICREIVEEVIKKTRPANDVALAHNFIKAMKPQIFKSHFMHAHWNEILQIRNSNIDLKNSLRKDYELSTKYRLKDLDVKTTHLQRWLESLPI
jgi:hypothetical protein